MRDQLTAQPGRYEVAFEPTDLEVSWEFIPGARGRRLILELMRFVFQFSTYFWLLLCHPVELEITRSKFTS